MENIKKNKDWDYVELSSNIDTHFRRFFDLYEKDRMAARLYCLSGSIGSGYRIVVFKKKSVSIILSEQVKYGVSTTLRMYKSVKVAFKYYFDSETGAVSKKIGGKFMPCKPRDVIHEVKAYIIKTKPWMAFLFEIDLPVTFTSIVTNKLYSRRKLLSWYWGTNYPTAVLLNNLNHQNNGFYLIKKNPKVITNLVNINKLMLSDDKHRELFLDTFFMAIKLTKTVNAAWSFKRLQLEYDKYSREIINTLYGGQFDDPLPIAKVFNPIIKLLLNLNFIIPQTTTQLAKMVGKARPEMIMNYVDSMKDEKSIVVKYENTIVQFGYRSKDVFKEDEDRYYSWGMHGGKNIKEHEYINQTLVRMNKYYLNRLKAEARKAKIGKIEGTLSSNLEITNIENELKKQNSDEDKDWGWI